MLWFETVFGKKYLAIFEVTEVKGSSCDKVWYVFEYIGQFFEQNNSNFKLQHKISWEQASQNLGIYNFVYVSVEKTWQTYYSAVDLLSSVVGRVQYIVNPSWLMSKVFS